MSKLNLSVHLHAYDDNRPSNAPSRCPIKWCRDLQGLVVNSPKSEDYTIAPGETRILFSGTRTLSQDNTTRYSLALKPLNTTIYVLSWASGTKPNFRTPRVPGDDATTQITSTINGLIETFTSTGGTPLSLLSGGVVVGDFVTLGSLFNVANQGTFQIIAVTATSFSVVNPTPIVEGPITLGAGFATQLQIFSTAGVQVGDTLVISSGFSPVTWGSYVITAVYAESLEFSSIAILPPETNILSAVVIYSMAKSIVYMESDQSLVVTVNGTALAAPIKPFILINCPTGLPSTALGLTTPGMLLLTSTIYSLSVTNNGIVPANVFLAAAE
jgi:hypothetical protein